MHVERGEERFLIEFYPVSGEVYYDLLAVSPACALAGQAWLLHSRATSNTALPATRILAG